MKGLILAAGRGTRIQAAHGQRPKCLIEFDGRTILQHQVESLLAAGVEEIGIVLGYKREQIIAHLLHHFRLGRQRFCFIFNPQFASTNNIYSLWLAREWLKQDDFVCLNADVVFDCRILAAAVESDVPVSMIVDPEWRDETMKVVIRGGRIVRMAKGISREEFSGTYIGVTRFAEPIQRSFFARLEALIRAKRVNEFFNVAVQQLADEGVHVGYSETGGMAWAEIDDPIDLAFARQHVFPRLAAPRSDGNHMRFPADSGRLLPVQPRSM